MAIAVVISALAIGALKHYLGLNEDQTTLLALIAVTPIMLIGFHRYPERIEAEQRRSARRTH